MKCKVGGCYYEAVYWFQRWEQDRPVGLCKQHTLVRWVSHSCIWPIVEDSNDEETEQKAGTVNREQA